MWPSFNLRLPVLFVLCFVRQAVAYEGNAHAIMTADAFDRSTRYEIAFWQMAYTRGQR